MNVTVIGGGSTYTPELLDGLLGEGQRLGLSEVRLFDIDAERQRVVGEFCRRIMSRSGAGFRLRLETDRAQALEGADYVITQIRVGGQAARHRDTLLGVRRGLVGQETTGVGGFSKALRTVPVLLELCRQMEQLCPRAWLINFTNPSGLVTEALLKYGRDRVIGLCNIPINLQYDAARLLGVEPGRVEIDSVGLNHLSFVREIRLDGQPVLADLLETLTRSRPANIEELDYPPEFIRALGMVPSGYLQYYWKTRQTVERQQAAARTRAEEVMEIEQALLDYYADPAHDSRPELLQKRGGALYSRAAVRLILALDRGSGDQQIVDVRNGTAVAELPEDSVVEVPCRVDGEGAHPLPQASLPPEIRGLLQQVKCYEQLAVEACVHRRRREALLALVAHPLVANPDLALEVLDDISAQFGIAFH